MCFTRRYISRPKRRSELQTMHSWSLLPCRLECIYPLLCWHLLEHLWSSVRDAMRRLPSGRSMCNWCHCACPVLPRGICCNDSPGILHKLPARHIRQRGWRFSVHRLSGGLLLPTGLFHPNALRRRHGRQWHWRRVQQRMRWGGRRLLGTNGLVVSETMPRFWLLLSGAHRG